MSTQPRNSPSGRWIGGRWHVWVEDQDLDLWMPVCPVCGNGPLDEEDVFCSEQCAQVKWRRP